MNNETEAAEPEVTMGLGGAATRPPVESTTEKDQDAEAAAALEALGASAPPPPSGEAAEEEEQPLPAGIPEDAPEEVKEALRPDPPEEDPDLTEAQKEQQKAESKKEVAVLDYLLGSRPPGEYEVTATLVVGDQTGELTFYFDQQDGDRILELEAEYGAGMGPFAQVDRFGLNCAICDEAIKLMRDETGQETDPKKIEFRGPYDSGVAAWRDRFKYQVGILDGVVSEIRLMSGFGTRAVGPAQKSQIANAVGNS